MIHKIYAYQTKIENNDFGACRRHQEFIAQLTLLIKIELVERQHDPNNPERIERLKNDLTILFDDFKQICANLREDKIIPTDKYLLQNFNYLGSPTVQEEKKCVIL